jgi:glycosyltransferase involved in cell wall biosynthesis
LPGDFLHYLELKPLMKPRLALVTAGHLSTCPRMLKAADALAEEGYEVAVVSTSSTEWAAEADLDVRRRRPGRWRSIVVDYSRSRRPLLYAKSGLGRRIARALAATSKDVSFPLATRAFGRVHRELVAAALTTSADLYYGGTTGGIGAAFEAAKRAGRPYALDLEDFFSGEPEAGSLDQRLAERIEREILPGAKFLTASSGPIAAAYSAKYGVATDVIHNVFPLPEIPPDLEPRPTGSLRLYWFSQTIGPGRGLEEAIAAVGLSGIEAELHLRGAVTESYLETLRDLARAEAPGLVLTVYPPGRPDEMTSLAGAYDVGLSLEQGGSVNNRLALGNKVLTYLLAGLALAMTDTPGQRVLQEALLDKALVVPPGDVKALAEGFRRFASDRRHLLDCRRASWNAAAARWHWEHPEERGRLLRLFEAATR